MILRARIVWPIVQPPIENGAVAVAGNRIAAVGRWADLGRAGHGEVVDLGETILLPGLINAHCHLDYTDLAGHIPPPRSFTDWIKAIVALKGAWTNEDFARSWQRGAAMLLRTGTTTVVDVEAVPELIPAMWRTTPLRVISFREFITLKNRTTAPAALEAGVNEWSALPEAAGRVGLSPHAPYTTSAETLQLASRLAREHGWRLTTHLAESEQEFEMFMYRHGPLFDWLKSQRDMADCGLGSPVRHLERCGYLGENLLAVHVNYLWREDAAVLARRRVSVVHCPRSHDYFRHLRFPRNELAEAGVNLCLGTDSLATVRPARGLAPELNLFAEMRQFAAQSPGLPPAVILKMATVNAARALGRSGELGELSNQALADVIAIPFSGLPAQAGEAVVRHPGPVAAVMLDGQWALPPAVAGR